MLPQKSWQSSCPNRFKIAIRSSFLITFTSNIDRRVDAVKLFRKMSCKGVRFDFIVMQFNNVICMLLNPSFIKVLGIACAYFLADLALHFINHISAPAVSLA